MKRPNHEDASIAALMSAPLAEQATIISALGMPAAGLLILMSPCEQRCHFCAQQAVTHPPPSDWTPRERIDTLLGDNAALELKRLCIGGTEPPTHPDFDRALTLASAAGFTDIELMTSATRLATPGLAPRWRAQGIQTIAAPIYSAQADVHDQVTGGANHERLLQGLDAAHAAGMQVRLHTLALKQNLSGLSALAAMCTTRWGTRLTVAPARPKPGVWDFNAEAPSLLSVQAAIQGANPDQIALTGWPSCLCPELERDAAQVITLYFMGQTRSFAQPCSDCTAKPLCPGVVSALLDRDGTAGLTRQ